MRLIIEGSEEILKTVEKIAKLASELSDEAYKLRFVNNNCRLSVTEETDPAAATTEPGKND